MPLAKSLKRNAVTVRQIAAAAQGTVTQTSAVVVTTAATQTTPYGFAGATQADAISTAINALVLDVANLTTLVNSLRSASVTNGGIKGGA